MTKTTTSIPPLTVEQIESIEFLVVGEGYPKKLVRVPINHPAQNAYGLVLINGVYYAWSHILGINKIAV